MLLLFITHKTQCHLQGTKKSFSIDEHHRHILYTQAQTQICLFPEISPPPTVLSPLGETAPTSSAKKATQGTPPPSSSGQRPLAGKLRETAAGGQEAPYGR